MWLGESDIIDRAQEEFWNLLSKLVSKNLENAPAVAVSKLVAECSVAIKSRGRLTMEKSETSLINRILIENVDDIERDDHCGGGLFYEYKIKKLDELMNIIRPKDQSISIFGVPEDDLRRFIDDFRPDGINRIVPIGRSLDFSSTWDGYNLLREFCREIDITL